MSELPEARLQMRVLILSDRYVPDATGTAIRASELVHSLLDRGLCEEIHVCTLIRCLSPHAEGERNLARNERLNGVYVHRYPSELSLVAGLAQLHRTCRFDLIHARGIRMGLFAWLLSGLSGIPYIVELNSLNPQHSFVKKRIWTHVLRSSERLIVLAKYAGEWLSTRFGISETRIDLVMNGVDLERFRASRAEAKAPFGSEENHIVGYTGAFLEWQGVFEFVHTAFLVAEECPTARFLMVGSGPALHHTQNLVGGYGISDKFIFTGLVSPQEVPSYIQEMDIFLIPRPPRFLKNHIATPLKLLEAMAMERAVVVSTVRGLSDVVDDGRTGLIAEPNAQSFASAVLKLIHDADLRRRMGKAAREAVEMHYTWEAAAQQLHQAYLKTVS